ncbi:MAG: hypothetical protein RLZZ242_1288 [Bacteroidota bacterium]|jgi:hypothetical protein
MKYALNEHPKALYVFLLLWFLAGAIQGALMPLSGEEAYYWLFSKNLQWGYLDHPPAVAFFAYLGGLIAPGEFGARLFSSILSTATLWLLYDLCGKKNLRLFIFMVLGLLAVHAGSFLIKTDVPLLFFETLFFWFYKRYLAREGFREVIGLAVAIVGMLLSKYHGVLIVFFTLLSFPKLVLKPSFWGIVLLSLILLSPHIYWLYLNDWSSFVFHLNDRADISFKSSNVLSYVLSQPVVLGPLVSFPVFLALLKQPTKDHFNRALQWVFCGVLIFFLIQSFRVFIHKHWTSVVLVPMMLLAFEPLSQSTTLALWVRRLSRVSLFCFVLFRVYLSYDYLPASISKGLEPLHHWKIWAQELEELSQGYPIVFINSYENASRYEFYSGNAAHTLSTVYFNNTQFDYWGGEHAFRDRKVLLVHHKRDQEGFETYTASNNARIYYRFVDRFRAFDRLSISIAPLEDRRFALTISNPYDFEIKSEPESPVTLKAYLLEGERIIKEHTLISSLQMKPKETLLDTFEMDLTTEVDRFHLRFGVQAGTLPPTINSNRLTLSSN